MTVELEINEDDITLECYRHLSIGADEIDIEFLYGGRDSGKSRETAQRLVLACIQDEYFRCIIARKVLNTVRDSQFSLLKSVIELWGIDFLFSINETRLEIICLSNGNGFFGRGLDDVGRIKSFNNPSHCWIEEGNQITSEDFVVVLTSLRAEVRTKCWFTFNPECDMTYTDFWLYQEWFSHTEDLSFTWVRSMTLEEGKEPVPIKVRATHTTYHDNPFCPKQRRALYESYKVAKNKKYWYQTYTLGLWGYKKVGEAFWKSYDAEVNNRSNPYNKEYPVHVVLDNNVKPYISQQFWQIDEGLKDLNQFHELPCSSPKNTASKAADETDKYLKSIGYVDKVYVYGDPSANNKSTTDDEGKSFFEKWIQKIESHGWVVVKRVKSSHDSVSMTGAFINEIYETNLDGWHIWIDHSCTTSIEDYSMTKENMNGGILKTIFHNKETGEKYEKYGHFSDCKRYFVTYVLQENYTKYIAKQEFKRPKSYY